MSTTRRVFPEVFKLEAVDRVISSGFPVSSYYEERYKARVLANFRRRATSLGFVLQEAPSSA